MKVSSKLVAGGRAADITDASGLFGFTVNDNIDFIFWTNGSASIFYSSFIRILYLWN